MKPVESEESQKNGDFTTKSVDIIDKWWLVDIGWYWLMVD